MGRGSKEADWGEAEYAVARNIARATMAVNGRLLDALGGTSQYDEIESDLASEIWKARRKYDPGRSQFTTFAGRIARNRLIDMGRRAAARRGRQAVVGQRAAETQRLGGGVHETDGIFSGELPGKGMPLRLLPLGRPGHPPRAYLGALLLRARRGLSWRGLARLIAADALVREELGFASAPSAWRLFASRKRLEAWARRRTNGHGTRDKSDTQAAAADLGRAHAGRPALAAGVCSDAAKNRHRGAGLQGGPGLPADGLRAPGG